MAASIASSNRDEALDKVYEEIEKDLIVSFNLHNSFLDIPNRIGDFIFITFFFGYTCSPWKFLGRGWTRASAATQAVVWECQILSPLHHKKTPSFITFLILCLKDNSYFHIWNWYRSAEFLLFGKQNRSCHYEKPKTENIRRLWFCYFHITYCNFYTLINHHILTTLWELLKWFTFPKILK